VITQLGIDAYTVASVVFVTSGDEKVEVVVILSLVAYTQNNVLVHAVNNDRLTTHLVFIS
jgi:hypothetical protein